MSDTVSVKREDLEFMGEQFRLMEKELTSLRDENDKMREKLEPKDLKDIIGVDVKAIYNTREILGVSELNS